VRPSADDQKFLLISVLKGVERTHAYELKSGVHSDVAAMPAVQLGFRTAGVECEHFGGICLNWGYFDQGVAAP
jgi:hypothetical protein